MTVYRHRISGTNPAGDVWSCTFHSESALIITSVHPLVEAQIVGDLLTPMQALWHSGVTANEIVTDQLETTHGHAVAQERTTVDIPGTSTDAQPPQGMCAVVSWVTNTPGRKGRGRLFLPGPVITAYAANGLLSAATANSIADMARTMLGDINTGSVTPVLLNKTTLATTVITTARVNVKPSYQRRRLNKVNNVYETG